MFGSFGGPLPQGKYNIRYGDLALTLPSVVNNTVVTMVASEERNESQVWTFEYGRKGYRIKSLTSGNYLSLTPWAIPARTVGQYSHVTASSDSPVEWKLVQTSVGTAARTFQLRVIAGNDLQPTDDIALAWNGNVFPTGGPSGTSFTFRGVATLEGTMPPGLTAANGTRCLIRSVYNPLIVLDARPNVGKLVVGNGVTGEDTQAWSFHKGGKGFRLRNIAVEDNLGFAVVANTPANTNNQSMVCQDDTSTEYQVVRSTEGFELRLASDPKLLVTIWSLDAGKNSWVYLDKGPSNGNAYTNQQWVFTKPGEDYAASRSAPPPPVDFGEGAQ